MNSLFSFSFWVLWWGVGKPGKGQLKSFNMMTFSVLLTFVANLHYFHNARANSIFWSRALNLPLPHSYVFPKIQEDQDLTCSVDVNSEVSTRHSNGGEPINENDGKSEVMRLSYQLYLPLI